MNSKNVLSLRNGGGKGKTVNNEWKGVTQWETKAEKRIRKRVRNR